MQIEVTVKNDWGEVVGVYTARHAFPATVVTVALWDGTPVVTDDKANTYTKESEA
jgi:hypothetical protein